MSVSPVILDPAVRDDRFYGLSSEAVNQMYRALECEKCGVWRDPAKPLKVCDCGSRFWKAVGWPGAGITI